MRMLSGESEKIQHAEAQATIMLARAFGVGRGIWIRERMVRIGFAPATALPPQLLGGYVVRASELRASFSSTQDTTPDMEWWFIVPQPAIDYTQPTDPDADLSLQANDVIVSSFDSQFRFVVESVDNMRPEFTLCIVKQTDNVGDVN